uniref:Uncharacterized protein n=1 Tax=Biomphalaria glabrata TaxID=6526 RepID=A0A2C9LSU6_BIOGL
MFDARIPPPEVKKTARRKVFNSTGKNYNRSASWSARQSRPRREAVLDIYLDLVAVIDYKLYSKYLALANYNSPTALQDILEHYAFVFSGIDMLYQDIKSSEYSIHVRLCKVYVLQVVIVIQFITFTLILW